MPPSIPPDVPVLNIISSHKISSKMQRCLSTLYSATPPVVALRAKSSVASKVITIAEIVKRRVAEQGDKWWQYTVLSSEEAKEKEKSGKARDQEGGKDEDEDPFVPMEKQGRRIPVITIYLSRERIEGMAETYGEQTNS